MTSGTRHREGAAMEAEADGESADRSLLGAAAVDGGDLPLGGGLLALIRPILVRLAPGALLAVLSRARDLRHDLPAYCRLEHHEYLGVETLPDGHDRHLVRRGPLGVLIGTAEEGITLPLRDDGRLFARDLALRVPWPEHADAGTGLAPRGAQVEPGGPSWPFRLVQRDGVCPPEAAALFDQAASAQWDASRDIPWRTVRPLPGPLERAVDQLMTFLAENELVALYVPSRFVARIHPAYAEVAQFLATQIADEARHVDVFLKRARAGAGGLGISSVTTSRSLRSLLDVEDFTESAFLLSVLGEGTFLDLLRFIETHAPDEATAELCRRARTDEARHVHFGLAHVRHALSVDPTLYQRLVAAARRRQATLAGLGGVPGPVADALTILAARGDDPPAVRRGHQAFRALLDEMHQARIKRLEHAGFSHAQAVELSLDHTPNFM